MDDCTDTFVYYSNSGNYNQNVDNYYKKFFKLINRKALRGDCTLSPAFIIFLFVSVLKIKLKTKNVKTTSKHLVK